MVTLSSKSNEVRIGLSHFLNVHLKRSHFRVRKSSVESKSGPVFPAHSSALIQRQNWHGFWRKPRRFSRGMFLRIQVDTRNDLRLRKFIQSKYTSLYLNVLLSQDNYRLQVPIAWRRMVRRARWPLRPMIAGKAEVRKAELRRCRKFSNVSCRPPESPADCFIKSSKVSYSGGVA